MRSLLVYVSMVLGAVLCDPQDGGGGNRRRPLIRATTLEVEAGTPDPVSEEVEKLLAGTDYTNEQIHYMPQTVSNPDCYVTTYVMKAQRHGGLCSRMDGGLPFCSVKNNVYPNHPDCVNREEQQASGGDAWGSSRWGPYYSRGAGMDQPTERPGDDSSPTNPRFRDKRDANHPSANKNL